MVSKSDPSKPCAAVRGREEGKGLHFRSNCTEPYNDDFDLRELLAALSECGETAPGPDDIPYVMLRHLSTASLTFLLGLYNRIWREGYVPLSWKEAIVLPIPKPGKDHSDVTNYRPICLTSCVCKLFEKMVNVRLVWYLERGGPSFPFPEWFP